MGVVRQESDAECAAVPPSAGYPGAVEQDTCRFPDGMVADFGAVADVAAFNRLRVALSSPPGIVPGTQWTGAWDGDEIRPGRWGVLHGEGFSTERLQRFWLTE